MHDGDARILRWLGSGDGRFNAGFGVAGRFEQGAYERVLERVRLKCVAVAAVYGATKAFDLMLAEALWAENRGRGVDVLAVSPGPTDTEFQAVAGEEPHAAVPPEDVVSATVGALGKQPSVIVGSANALRTFALRFAPRALIARVAEMVMRGNLLASGQ